MKYELINLCLRSIEAVGIGRMLRPIMGGMGCILTLHHVRPLVRQSFHPNAILEITPKFLSQLIIALKAEGYAFVSMTQVAEIVSSGKSSSIQKFIALTFDDGYRDNLEYAVPILNAHNVPYCIYIPTAYPSGEGILWWIALEAIIRKETSIHYCMNGHEHQHPTETIEQKQKAWKQLSAYIRGNPAPIGWQIIQQIAHRAGYDLRELTTAMIMNWDELAVLSHSRLCTLGAHTMTHSGLAKMDTEWVKQEMSGSLAMLESKIDDKIWHFAYPYGSIKDAAMREYNLARDLGFLTAVTTRPGVITAAHGERMTALPRISVNGLFQNIGIIKTLCSGFPVRIFNN